MKTHWQYEDTYCEKHSICETKEKSKYPCFSIKDCRKFMNEFLSQFPDLASKIGDLRNAKSEWENAEKEIRKSGCIFYDYRTREYFLTQSKWSHQWGLPRGKINKYENSRLCAAREMKEEIGYDIDASPSVPYCIVRNRINGNDWMYYVLLCNKKKMKFHLNRTEVIHFKWESFKQMKLNAESYPKEYAYLYEFFCFFEKFENEILKDKIKPKRVTHFTNHSDDKLREFTITVFDFIIV